MPTFVARRYFRPPGAVGRTEITLGLLILALVAAVVAVFAFQVSMNRDYLFTVPAEEQGRAAASARPASPPRIPPRERAPDEIPAKRAASAAIDQPFPSPEFEGWAAPRLVERFTADILYEKIDGQADAYLKFHVVGLTFGSYTNTSDAARTIDVYWYNMGTAQNALDMYQSEAPPDAARVPIGDVGYEAGGAVFFCQASSYVQVMPSDPSGADAAIARRIAERLTAGGAASPRSNP